MSSKKKKAASSPRFDVQALRTLAGEQAFSRGEAYFRQGMVEIIGNDRGRVLARVAGTEEYRTIVTGAASIIEGECSCPAFDRFGFCKHMVAVALAANEETPDGNTLLGSIRAYLKTMDADRLVGMIIDAAGRDPDLLRKLELASIAAGADDGSAGPKLRSAISDATRTRGFIDYGRAPDWAAGVAATLDALDDMAGGQRAAVAAELAVYAIERIERAIADIDDSDGYCSMLFERAQQIHLDACRSAGSDPVALARDLFRRETEGEYGVFRDAAARYAEVLGETGLGEYRRLAEDAWEKLPAGTGPDRETDDFDPDDDRLASILDFFAERDGDLERRIALRRRDLTSSRAYLELAGFCREHGRAADALRFAEEGLWLFEDEWPQEGLVSLAVDLLLEAGRKDEAETLLWRAFERAPSIGLYGRLRRLGGAKAARRTIDFLRGRLDGVRATPWHSLADLLVRVLVKERMFGDAWDSVRDHGASPGIRMELAAASESTHAAEALAVYAERVEEFAATGGNQAYEQAASLIARMAGLRDATEQAAYLADVRERHRRKRNLLKLLG